MLHEWIQEIDTRSLERTDFKDNISYFESLVCRAEMQSTRISPVQISDLTRMGVPKKTLKRSLEISLEDGGPYDLETVVIAEKCLGPHHHAVQRMKDTISFCCADEVVQTILMGWGWCFLKRALKQDIIFDMNQISRLRLDLDVDDDTISCLLRPFYHRLADRTWFLDWLKTEERQGPLRCLLRNKETAKLIASDSMEYTLREIIEIDDRKVQQRLIRFIKTMLDYTNLKANRQTMLQVLGRFPQLQDAFARRCARHLAVKRLVDYQLFRLDRVLPVPSDCQLCILGQLRFAELHYFVSALTNKDKPLTSLVSHCVFKTKIKVQAQERSGRKGRVRSRPLDRLIA